jgi:quercetin dioxygenase-like cupin family protein
MPITVTPWRAIEATTAASLILLSSSFGLVAKSGKPAIVVVPVLSTGTTASGQPIILPSGPARVIVSTYVIAPGARLPVHRHPYPRYAYVLEGHLRVTEVKSHRATSYKKGDFIVEMIGQEHFGQNTGDGPLRLLVIDIVPKNVSNNSHP